MLPLGLSFSIGGMGMMKSASRGAAGFFYSQGAESVSKSLVFRPWREANPLLLLLVCNLRLTARVPYLSLSSSALRSCCICAWLCQAHSCQAEFIAVSEQRLEQAPGGSTASPKPGGPRVMSHPTAGEDRLQGFCDMQPWEGECHPESVPGLLE